VKSFPLSLSGICAGWLLLLLTIAASCDRSPQDSRFGPAPPLNPASFDGRAALEEVRAFIALGPRVSGTPGAARAAQYIAARLETLGIDPLVEEFTALTVAGLVTFRNVTGVIPGNGKATVVIGSHYDTKSGISATFAGANDAGSSTGLLLRLAAQLQAAAPLPADVVVAFFDGEECLRRYGPRDGLHGSRHLARALVRNRRADRVRAVVILDMIGDRDLQVTIPRNSSARLITLAFDAAAELGVRDKFALARGMVTDDHVPFLEGGMPAIDLIDFEFGSAPGRNDYWHTTQDTLDKLSAESLETVGRVTLQMLNRLMRED